MAGDQFLGARDDVVERIDAPFTLTVGVAVVEVGGERNLLAQTAADEPANRQSRRLAHEVEAGELEARDRAISALAVVERHEGRLRQHPLDVEGVLAEKHRRDLGVDEGLGDRAAEGLAQSQKAIVASPSR